MRLIHQASVALSFELTPRALNLLLSLKQMPPVVLRYGGSTIKLTNSSTTFIGRRHFTDASAEASTLLRPKISRKQLHVQVEDGKVYVECLGVNPSYLIRVGEPPLQLNAGDKQRLHDQDAVNLIVSKYPIVFTIPKKIDETSEIATASTANLKKRKRTDEEFDEPEPKLSTSQASSSSSIGKGEASVPPPKKAKTSEEPKAQSSSSLPTALSQSTDAPLESAFDELMKNSQKQVAKPPKPAASAAAEAPASGGAAKGGGWSGVLGQYCIAPEKFPDLVTYYNTKVVVIKDVYPKAKFHFLVMPRQLINGPEDLSKQSLPILNDMKNVGERVARDITAKNPSIQFKIGFHAVPSMKQLHMHVISTDFDSASLKIKKHWNSFTTAFFIPVDDLIATVTKTGKASFDQAKYEAMLTGPLECHRCGTSQKNIPALKQHIQTCSV